MRDDAVITGTPAWIAPWEAFPGAAGQTGLRYWRVVRWTDETEQPVQEIVCHQQELPSVLNLPFPRGAVVREPSIVFTGENVVTWPICWFQTQPHDWELWPGEGITLTINQGDRDGVVLAAIGTERLLEYEMPRGTTALRVYDVVTERERSVAYRSLALKWLRVLVETGVQWIGNPQHGRRVLSPEGVLREREYAA
jgi:hypothetical protein